MVKLVDQLVSKISSKKWDFYVDRKFNYLVESTQILANSTPIQKKYLGFDVSAKNYLILNGREFGEDDDNQRIYLVFDELFENNSAFFEDFSKKIWGLVNLVSNYRDKLVNKDFSKLFLSETIVELQNFSECYVKSFVPTWSRPDDYLEKKTKTLLKKELNLNDQKAEAIFSKIATYPSLAELSYNQEHLELLKIAQELKYAKVSLESLPANLERKLVKHIEKYSWMKSPVFKKEDAFSKKDYLERLKVMLAQNVKKEIEQIDRTRAQNEKQYQKVVKSYSLTEKLLKLIEAVRGFILLRTLTSETSDRLFFTARKTLLTKVAEKLGLRTEELVMLSFGEILECLDQKRSNVKKLILERKRQFVIIWLNGEVRTFWGEEAIEFYSQLKIEPLHSQKGQVKELKGKVASNGVVRGKVRLVRSDEEVKNFKEGEILVASMTTPDYISAMEKASGFITDEGGITCHAAIIAREFGLPCIVGTKIATQILKTGNLVELDANKGVVKVLNVH